jgi:hypothetical protein
MSSLEDISGYLIRLTQDQINAAVAQVDAHQFNRDRQPLDFDTAVERLRWCRDAVQGALDNNLLTTLPPSIQREVRDALSNAVPPLEAIAAGGDQLNALASSVDVLHVVIWRNRIAERASRVINLAEKTDQLTRLSAEAQRIRADLTSLLEKAAGIGDLLQQSREAASAAVQAQQQADAARQEAAQQAQQAQTSMTEATERNNQVNAILGQARTTQQEIATIQQGLKTLYSEGADFRKRITQSEQQAQAMIAETKEESEQTISEHNTRTEALLNELESNEARIRHALDEATGVSLFDSFDKRRDTISKGKWLWVRAAAALALVTAVILVYALLTCKAYTPILYLKLGLLLPLGALVWVCFAQYSHERRLEEAYAFKSNISLSLVPYKDLVATAFGSEDEASKSKYAQFLVDSVGKVFTPPADHRAQVDLSALTSAGTEQLKHLTALVSSLQKLVRG